MITYAVITQNDESKWDDLKGEIYNYPSRYKSVLANGCRIIYYKGKMTNPSFLPYRLSAEAHYFGIGVIGDSIIDPDSSKKDRFCEILEYQEFNEAVPINIGEEYLEAIPYSKRNNYWRFGVREISKAIFEKIISYTTIGSYRRILPNENQELESYDLVEGKKRIRFSSYFERNPFYRNKAIVIHGLSCMVCKFNFERAYGKFGKGFIHVHHNKPLSESGPTRINPVTDFSVLCPNCHAMIHRNKYHTLSIEQLIEIISST